MSKVSIIIPVYNAEKYLKKCIESLINQTLSDIEIIFIDDKSTDNSLEIIKHYEFKDERIKVVENDINRGQGPARNLGVEIAQSEYIMFLDQDDWYEPTACEEAYNQISKNNNDLVIFNFTKIYEKTNRKLLDPRLGRYSEYFSNKNLKFSFFENSECWTKIYRKNFLTENNIVNYSGKSFGEDLYFTTKMILAADTFSILNKSLYNYRVHDNNMSRKPLYDDLININELNFSIVKKSKNSEIFKRLYAISYIRSLLFFYKIWTKNNPSIKKDFYLKIKNVFIKLMSEIDFNTIKFDINYSLTMKIINNSYYKFELLNFLEKIFSVNDIYSFGYKRKFITILGLKFRIMKKKIK